MAFQVSPGVNVSEIDLTTIVPAVATSLGGIAGAYEWGPAKKVVLIDTPQSYRNIFGSPTNWNYAQWFSGLNFLGYSRALQVVRVVDEEAKNASNKSTKILINNEEEFENQDGIYARYPGEFGNSIRVAIFAGSGVEEGFRIDGILEGPSAEYVRGDLVYIYEDGEITGTTLGSAEIFNYDTEAKTLLLKNVEGDWSGLTDGWYIMKGQGESGEEDFYLEASKPGLSANVNEFTFWGEDDGDNYSKYFGTFGEGAPESTENIRFLAGATNDVGVFTNDQIHVLVLDKDGKFTGSKNTVLERFPNLSVFPEARLQDGTVIFWKNYINKFSKYIMVGGADLPQGINSITGDFFVQTGIQFTLDEAEGFGYIVDWGKEGPNGTVTPSAIPSINLTGGFGSEIDYDKLVDSTVPSTRPFGYNLFEDTENYDVNLLISGGITTSPSMKAIQKIAEDRKDCMAFFSSDVTDDSGSETSKLNKCVSSIQKLNSSSYSVLDTGYKYQYDPYNDIYRWIPLNADIAGLCARTEFERDAWFSPAGYNRGQIRSAIKLAFNPSKAFRDQLYPLGINPVISSPGEGIILLGDKTTLKKPSAFDRINVRRLFIVLEKAIATASKYSLFEFNDDFTRARFVALVQPFLEDVRSRRGIFDFKVVCDQSNNTPERIDRNEFWADIYIKPARSINFIQLNFIATRTDANFSELGA